MYKPVQIMKEAQDILNRYPHHRYPNLTFLPDVARLKIAGEDAIKIIAENFKRIEAIHLKDWREDVDRSYQFYALGFCELGTGDVALTKILQAAFQEAARDNTFPTRWLVVEQDKATNPPASATRSYKWLRDFIVTRSGGLLP